ncbi:hypothetical protein HELRODRAFT_192191 [Helobdella robusta]|uniref:Ig-like domain-containing protein n=1 Tax=Helobdella robusta TaxID=6412 RepID=T1FTP0_HELRO|nr:hypothetical protein HELRODRAFT_192191 [Helobdella robusta]ESO01577.1 hypothetical protein HELRODRAFT_192191 [Helobdella robusta]
MVINDPDYYEVTEALARGPNFDITLANVTVVEGQMALLPCYVNNLGHYKVSWTYDNVIVTYEKYRVLDDVRFSLIHPTPRNWDLQIRDVLSTDSGAYRCIIGINPPLTKVVNLVVKVPAKILDTTKPLVKVSEFATAILECDVTGYPRPHVTWTRVVPHKFCDASFINGTSLILRNVSRMCGGVYECKADNSIKMAATKDVLLIVEYPPKINIRTKRLKQAVGMDTIIECSVDSNPRGAIFWRKFNGDVFSYLGNQVSDQYDDVILNSDNNNNDINNKRFDDYDGFNNDFKSLRSDFRSFTRQNVINNISNDNINNINNYLTTNYNSNSNDNRDSNHESSRYFVDIYENTEVDVTNVEDDVMDDVTASREKIILSLRIENLRISDFGIYTCVAINNHGRDDLEMELLEYKIPKLIAPTGETVLIKQVHIYHGRNAKAQQNVDEPRKLGRNGTRVVKKKLACEDVHRSCSSLFKARDCYFDDLETYCCLSCKKFLRPDLGHACRYGDKEKWCMERIEFIKGCHIHDEDYMLASCCESCPAYKCV